LGKLGYLEDCVMSTRERWIVYPLLFMTLGIVIRDKVLPRGHLQANEVTAGRIHCNWLQVDQVATTAGMSVRSLQCGDQVVTGKIRCGELRTDQVIAVNGLVVRGIQCGELVVVGPNGRPTVLAGTDSKTKGGLITTLSPAGTPLVLLQPTDSGGVVRAAQIVQSKMALPEKPKTSSPPITKVPSKESSNAPETSPAKPGK
jgi:hypothetical protein